MATIRSKYLLSMMNAFAYGLYFIVVVVVLLEIVLRFYDPFGFRQQGDTVVLPRNRKMKFENKNIPVLPGTIIHTKNSLGFRGPEPVNLAERTSIIAIGGSTTECFYLSDDSCWTSLLSERLKSKIPNIWINNAGYQGHSTFGNFILLNEHVKKLNPDYVLLMAGMNEINRNDILKDESVSINSGKVSAWGWLKRNSRVTALALNIQRWLMAERLHVTDNYVPIEPNEANYRRFTRQYADSVLAGQQPLVDAYQKRLGRFLDSCLANKIKPVLITQPMLFGYGFDCKTNADLSLYNVGNIYNGEIAWKLLELYNNATRQTARNYNIPLIDLAYQLPKCSTYFYDICHFTNEGSNEVSRILALSLSGIVK
jgi:lysophospholipase L1-like esterase